MDALGEYAAVTAAGVNAPGSGVAALLQGRKLRSVPAAGIFAASGAGFRALAPAHDGGAAAHVRRCVALLESAMSTRPEDLAPASFAEAADFAGIVEDLSRRVEYLQLLAATAVDKTRTEAIIAAGTTSRTDGWTTGWRIDNAATASKTATAAGAPPDSQPAAAAATFPAASATTGSPADDGCRNTAEYLRTGLRISAAEARRRLALAAELLPGRGLTGQAVPPRYGETAAALASGAIGSRSASIITMALEKVQPLCSPEKAVEIEHALARTAEQNDQDFLARIARRWTEAVDQDGAEPSEEALRHLQGAFLRRPKHGLQHVEIFATQDQYEHLLTVMNTATNPRTSISQEPGARDNQVVAGGGSNLEGAPATNRPGPVDDAASLDRRTRAQKMLDGLLGACKIALAAGALPAAGGQRPQVLATIDYRDLLGELKELPALKEAGRVTGTGSLTFTGPVPAATLRKIACDADIIPVVLGGEGQVLDIGRASRIFPAHIRKAITARDKGCAFPGCTMPAPWCEAHHIDYWSRGGPSSAGNGTLLCSHHHHLIHKEDWRIQIQAGVPWFIPPPHIDPRQQPRKNPYFQV